MSVLRKKLIFVCALYQSPIEIEGILMNTHDILFTET